MAELIDPETGKPPNPLDPKAVNRAREAASGMGASAKPAKAPSQTDQDTGVRFGRPFTEEERLEHQRKMGAFIKKVRKE